MNEGWSPGYTTTLYTLGVAFGAVVTVLTPVPMAVGAVAGGGFTGFYHFLDAGERNNLKQRLNSEAMELATAGGKVRNASDILEHCVLSIIELKAAVGEAQLSTTRMTGHLRPEDALGFVFMMPNASTRTY